MDDFIPDNELVKIPIKDSGENLVDLEEYIPGIIIRLSPRIYGRRKFKAYLREGVAKRLKEAQRLLPKGLTFKIFDAYRPITIQRNIFKKRLDLVRRKHPKWSKKKAYRYAAKFTADPKVIAPHSTGGSVDLTITRQNGKELEMGGTSESVSCIKADGISSIAKKNRAILAKVMTKAGFVNYPIEWWHWSYGDRYWAAVKKKKCVIYNTIRQINANSFSAYFTSLGVGKDS